MENGNKTGTVIAQISGLELLAGQDESQKEQLMDFFCQSVKKSINDEISKIEAKGETKCTQ